MQRVLPDPADELKRVQSVCAWQEVEITELRRRIAVLEAELDATVKAAQKADDYVEACLT